tara:strand:- start:968 stop:2251 length:1284 start_codon:yes stop_codon:yes gene_type:complete
MKNYNNKYEPEELKEITLKSNISNYSKTVLFIFIFIALSIALSFFIKYPKKIVGKAFIVSETQTNKVLAPNDGTIEVFIKERQYVKKGETLALIVNPANYNHIIELKNMINQFNLDSIYFSKSSFKYNPKFKLGDLGKNYYDFLLALFEYENILKVNLSAQKINNLKKKINRNKKIIVTENYKGKLINKKAEILNKKYKIDSILFKEDIILKDEMVKSKMALLNSKEGVNSVISKNQNLAHINSEIFDQISLLKKEKYIQTLSAIFNVKKKFFELKTMVDFWEHNYVIKSPIEGRIEFYRPFFSSDVYVKRNMNLFIILPDVKNYYGTGIMRADGYGKISENDTVIIKLRDYPYKEYGHIKGVVLNKSKVFHDSIYYLNISLPFGLKANVGKEIKFSFNMPGTVECITQKTSLIQRIFNEVNNSISN